MFWTIVPWHFFSVTVGANRDQGTLITVVISPRFGCYSQSFPVPQNPSRAWSLFARTKTQGVCAWQKEKGVSAFNSRKHGLVHGKRAWVCPSGNGCVYTERSEMNGRVKRSIRVCERNECIHDSWKKLSKRRRRHMSKVRLTFLKGVGLSNE